MLSSQICLRCGLQTIVLSLSVNTEDCPLRQGSGGSVLETYPFDQLTARILELPNKNGFLNNKVFSIKEEKHANPAIVFGNLFGDFDAVTRLFPEPDIHELSHTGIIGKFCGGRRNHR